MSDKKPCVLEGAPALPSTSSTASPVAAHGPCALCAAEPDVKEVVTKPAPPEDETADPVGDGHSDAQWAERHAPGPPAPADQ